MKRHDRSRKTDAACLVAALLAGLGAGPARAGGLYLGEFATPSTGTANAGAGALGRDASAAFHNPAAMTQLEEHQAMLGLAPGFGVVEFDPAADTPVAGSDGGNQAGFLPLFSAHYVHALTGRIRLGLSGVSLSGAALNPRSDWVGRNQATKIELITLSLLPSAALEITDWLSIGAGPLVTYANLDARLRPPTGLGPEADLKLDELDDWAVAAVVGVHLAPIDDVGIGVVYLSESKLDLSGDVKAAVGLDARVDLDLPLAQRVIVDLRYQATPKLGLLMTAGWEDWSALETTAVSVAGVGTVVEFNLKDTWKLGGGLEYRLRDDLLLQTGVTYDSSPLDTKDRTALLPLDEQIRVGVGTLWDYSESISLGFNFEWVNLGKARLDNAFVKGKYDPNSLFLFGLNVNWKNLPWAGWGRFEQP